jgi:hypothetical protein
MGKEERAERAGAVIDPGADYRVFRNIRTGLFLLIALVPFVMLFSGHDPASETSYLSVFGGFGFLLDRFMGKLRRARRLP